MIQMMQTRTVIIRIWTFSDPTHFQTLAFLFALNPSLARQSLQATSMTRLSPAGHAVFYKWISFGFRPQSSPYQPAN
jgi:hypothetical protein